MPSRRRMLAGTGVVCSVGALGGCLSPFASTKTGHLQLKAVTVGWEYRARSWEDQPLFVTFDVEERRVAGRYDPDFVGDAVRAPDDVVVTDDVHEDLSGRFDVAYAIGVCGEDFAAGDGSYGCHNTATSRAEFNRVQLNDRAEVRVVDDRFDVVGVEADAHDVDTSDLRTFDFAARHSDHGLSGAEW